MNLPEFGVRRPVTNLMIFFGIIILSLYGLSRLGVDMMPEIEPPNISVISTYPGASPEDVEVKVTEPLENQLASTPRLERITSRSAEGVSAIQLKFIWGANLDEASNDIRDRIERAKRLLPDIPDEMDNPFIFKFNTAQMPIMVIGITADQNTPELFDLIDNRVGDQLRQVAGVGTVQVRGGLERQINVWVDRARLEGYGFSILDVGRVLAQANVTEPVGSIKSGMTDYLVRLPGEFTSPEEINTVILGQRQGRLVYVKDVARVEDSWREEDHIVRINRKSGLMMMVLKQTGENTVQVADRVKKRLEQIKPSLPVDIEFSIVMDSSQDILRALRSLGETVWVAGVLVIFVTWFFLRRMRPSLIIALTIPFSILIAFIYLFLSGRTINVVSLMSLTIAIGMVVDNAIVVVDNVIRHLDRGERPLEAAIFGTSEMFLAIAASTATTVVVFLPMVFVTGVVGIMFGEMAIIITVTLVASLFTAATFTPMLCSKWLRRQANGDRNGPRPENAPRRRWGGAIYNLFERWFTAWERAYARILNWSVRTTGHRIVVVLGFAAAFGLSLSLIRLVGTEFMPDEDTGDLRVTMQLPVGTRLEETDAVSKKVEDIFQKEVPERRFMYVQSGQGGGIGMAFGGASGSHTISCGAKVVPKDERRRSAMQIAQAVRQKVKAVPGVLNADISAGNPLARIITGGGGKKVQIEVIGHSFETTDAVAARLKAILEQVEGAVDVSVSREMKRPELRIAVDREKAAALGLDMRTVADTVATCIEGATATRYRERGQTYDIYVRLEEAGRSKPEDIESLTVVSPYTGVPVRMASIATVYEATGPLQIERKNRERIVRVECNVHGRAMGKVIEDARGAVARMTLPLDAFINWGGEYEEQVKAFKDLTLLLLLGVALVYMVMAAQFESLLSPFIIMFAIPFTFTGVILGFVVSGTTLSVVTFLGIVMLMGIVVNNAIVLISYIDILRARGFSMLEAVTQGGQHRLRPVLMTTITTLAGWLPLALSRGEGSEVWQPLGLTMIGGLTVSTLLTLVFVPTFYALIESWRKKNHGPKPATA
ncbi:MAG: efflux RND transporter permease subunit [Verrucomicrobiota bacterium]